MRSRIQGNKKGLELNEKNQLIVHAYEINLLETETLLRAGREVGLQVNTEKSSIW
jgi:hypothetical protein